MKLVLATILLISTAWAQNVPAPDVPTKPLTKDINPEVARIAMEDQWDRGRDLFGNREIKPNLHGETVAARDERRQRDLRQIIDAGKLETGNDFFFAALVFQHSTKPEGIMLAHVLAVTAVSKGQLSGKWMAAASLDRYLLDVGQPQVFGTQFNKDSTGQWTLEPYARDTISDNERAVWCVVSRAEQQRILEKFRHGGDLESTGVRECK